MINSGFNSSLAKICSVTMTCGNWHITRNITFVMNTDESDYKEIGELIEQRYGANLIFEVPDLEHIDLLSDDRLR